MDLANNNLPQLAKQPIHPMNNIVLKYHAIVKFKYFKMMSDDIF